MPATPRAFAISLALAAGASADVAYDNLTGQPLDGTLVFGAHEVAQDVQLDPAAGLEIVGVQVRLRNPTQNIHDTGTLTISLFADAGGRPGDLLATYAQPYQIPPDTIAIYTTSFAPFLSPTRDLWASWHIDHDSLAATGIAYGGDPFVGSTTNHHFARPDGMGDWLDQGAWRADPFHIRVTAVPEPGAALCLLLLAARRRR